MNIGASVTDVHNAVIAYLERRLQLFEYGNLPIARRNADDGLDLSRGSVIVKARSENMVVRNDTFERRLNNLLGGSGDHVEGEGTPVEILQQLRKKADIRLKTNLFPYLDEVLFSDTPILGVMQQEVSQFTALLDEMHARQTIDLLGKVRGANKMAQD
jgi:hypothetical protein